MLGADGPPSSNQKFLVLNRALHVKPKRPIQCFDGIPDEPGCYTVLLGWKTSGHITFKQDSTGKILVWQVDWSSVFPRGTLAAILHPASVVAHDVLRKRA